MILRRRRTGTGQRWGVVAQVREPVELLLAFAAFHLDAGAARVTLYFDDPDDPAFDVLAGVEGVEAIRCDRAHWRRAVPLIGRPKLKTYRQVANFRHAYRRSDLDWLAHLDADEFLHMPNGIGPSIAARAPDAAWIKLPVAERFWIGEIGPELFGGHFRTKLPGPKAVAKVYGPDETFLRPRGMAGHDLGKPLVPTNRRDFPVIHDVRHRIPFKILPSSEAVEAHVFHFEGLTAKHWALKQMRQSLLILAGAKPMRDTRRQVTLDILTADDPREAALDWFHRVYVLRSEIVAALEARNAVLSTDLDIARKARPLLERLGLTFTPAGLDARISDDLDATVEEVLRRRTALGDRLSELGK